MNLSDRAEEAGVKDKFVSRGRSLGRGNLSLKRRRRVSQALPCRFHHSEKQSLKGYLGLVEENMLLSSGSELDGKNECGNGKRLNQI